MTNLGMMSTGDMGRGVVLGPFGSDKPADGLAEKIRQTAKDDASSVNAMVVHAAYADASAAASIQPVKP
jgi:hypothetical protein